MRSRSWASPRARHRSADPLQRLGPFRNAANVDQHGRHQEYDEHRGGFDADGCAPPFQSHQRRSEGQVDRTCEDTDQRITDDVKLFVSQTLARLVSAGHDRAAAGWVMW